MTNNDSATKPLNNTQGPRASDRRNDYNLMVNVRFLYSSLVLMVGWSSRIQSASSVKRCIVESRIDRFGSTLGQMVFDWTTVVDMLSEAGLHVSAGLANIARVASWT